MKLNESIVSNPVVLFLAVLAAACLRLVWAKRKGLFSMAKKEQVENEKERSILFTPLRELKQIAATEYPWDEVETRAIIGKCATVIDHLCFYESAVSTAVKGDSGSGIPDRSHIVTMWWNAMSACFNTFVSTKHGYGEVHQVLTECEAALHRNEKLVLLRTFIHLLQQREQALA